MELHQLQCFIAVLEEGGFKRATTRLGITQPALSYQIKHLEDELGVQLFHRRPGGVSPTEAGRVLLQHAHQVIAVVEEAHQAVRGLSQPVSGVVRIGAIKCVGTYFLPGVLRVMREKHPGLTPQLLYRNSDELLEALLASKLDVAIVDDPPSHPRLKHELVFEERISLVSGRGHPFHGRPTVEVPELEGQQLVSLSPQTPTGALIQHFLQRLGISSVPALTTDNIETVKRMVEEGMGVAFLPDLATDEDVAGQGRAGRLWRSTVEPALYLNVAIAWREAHRTPALDALIPEVCRMGRECRMHAEVEAAGHRPAP